MSSPAIPPYKEKAPPKNRRPRNQNNDKKDSQLPTTKTGKEKTNQIPSNHENEQTKRSLSQTLRIPNRKNHSASIFFSKKLPTASSQK